MRLKHVSISNYKNLNNFKMDFEGDSFIEVFVGKNGSGKSNFFEALIEIFRHMYEYDAERNSKDRRHLSFDFVIKYQINGKDIEIIWRAGQFNIDGTNRKTIGNTPLPDNVLIYYSGHNKTVANVVEKYESTFSRRIKDADFNDSRSFIGIGSEYKELLLAILLIQNDDNKARKFIINKLGIKSISSEFNLILKRPFFADKKNEIEDFDPRTHYWGAEGITRQFLEKLIECIKGEFSHATLYNSKTDLYQLPINLKLFQSKFTEQAVADTFRQFDNLKTLGMLESISIPLKLNNGLDATIAHFSDGQFQSVYIYSIVEIFKNRNCITLLDEPDAFLHPEWQYDLLKQVFEINNDEAKNNHILMSSHSAVTLIPHEKKKVNFFNIKENYANCYPLPKNRAIKELSSDLIKYSEQEQLLSIINAIQIENKPVLFTEGSTDPIILKTAWYNLYTDDIPFIPFYAFSCTFINQLLTDIRIHNEMNGLPIFALFDFDKAYDQWNGLNGDIVEEDIFKGMVKKWKNGGSYAIMLPIPQNKKIKEQVIKNSSKNETYGGNSYCEIEHLFYGFTETSSYYQIEPCVGGGQKIVFKSDNDKTKFAKEVIPTLSAEKFEVFRPMFEFIKATITTA